jgi:zinc protease
MLLRTLLLPVLSLSASPLAPQQPSSVFPFEAHESDLPNGLRVITVPSAFPDLVTLYVIVATGSRNEVEPGKSGFAHFFEHMMFRGTKHHSAAEQAAFFKRIGAGRNAYTTDDYTAYHTTFGKEDLDGVMRMEADRFRFLQYDQRAFRTEAMAVLGEYNKNAQNPTEKLEEALRETAFTTHPYRHTTIGFLRDIVAMPRQYDYSLEFFRRWYAPQHTTLLIVGDVDPAAVRELAATHFGDWPRGTAAEVAIPREPPQSQPRSVHQDWPTPTSPWLVVAWKGPAFAGGESDMPVLDVLSALTFGSSSELYRRLYVQERKVDVLAGMFPDATDPYLLQVWTRVREPADVAYVRDAILAAARAAGATAPEPAQLDRIKRQLRYGFASRLDSSEGIASALAGVVARTRTTRTIARVQARYDAVTPADVAAAAQQWLRDECRTVATLAHGALPEPAPGGDARPHLLALPSRSPLISIRVAFAAGAAADPPGQCGLASLTARLLATGGTKRRSYARLLDDLLPLAASIGWQVDKELTVLHGTVHRDNLEPYWGILREVLAEPAFAPDDFARVRADAISAIELDLVQTNDEELGKETLYRELYAGTPYGWLNGGTLADLRALGVGDAERWWRERLRASRATIALAGDLPEGFAERARAELAHALPGGTPPAGAAPITPAPLARNRLTIVQKETRATGLHLGFPIEVRRGDPDWVALWLVRSWLGEHRSENSHLYQRLRELRGLNYGDYAYIEYFPRGMFQFQPDPNLVRRAQIFQIWIRPVPPENAAFALKAAWYELDALVRNGLTAAQFDATREYLRKFAPLLVATQERQLGYAYDSEWYGTPAFVDYVRRGLEKLTLDEVNAAIRRHLRSDRLQLVAVAQDAAALRDAVLGTAPTPITYQSRPGPDVLAEDDVIAALRIPLDPDDVRILPATEVFAK